MILKSSRSSHMEPQGTKVVDVIEKITYLKWKWEGHIAIISLRIYN